MNERMRFGYLTYLALVTVLILGSAAALLVVGKGSAVAQGDLEEAYVLVDTWEGTGGQGAPGSVLYPAGIEVTQTEVYIVDRGNHRIEVFSPAGEYLRTWGQMGSELDDLLWPQDVAVDGSAVYVSDPGNSRVMVYDSQGRAAEAWTAPQLDEPWGVAARGGRVYVTQPSANEVVVLEGGKVVGRWSDLEEPRGIAVGPDGRVYVAETASSAVGIYSAAGSLERKLESKLAPLDVAVDRNGDLYVQSRGAILWFEAGMDFSRMAMYFVPYRGVGVHWRQGIYATVASDALQFHGVLKYPWRPIEPPEGTRWPLLAYPPGRFSRPLAVTVSPSDEIWVLDEWPRAQALDRSGRPIKQFPLPAQQVYESLARRAVDLSVKPNGEIVAGEPNFIHRLMPDGTLSGTRRLAVGTSKFWLTGIDRPASDDYVLVLDSAQMFVRRYGVTRTLQLRGGWPLSAIASPNVWELYWDMAVDRAAGAGGADRLYAVNRTSREIEIYEGATQVRSFPAEGIPSRVAVGPDGDIFVLTAGGIVWKHTPEGRMVAGWDAGAYSAGSSDVADLAVDSAGRVYTLDRLADTLRVWDVDPNATPEPPQSGGSTCRLRGDKRAAPESLKIGQTVEVELAIGGECPNTARQADIVLAIDRSWSMNEDNKITTTIRAAQTFIGAVDLSKDRVAIVTFNNSARLEQQLTSDRAKLDAALTSIVAVGGTDIADAIAISSEELTGDRMREDALPVIILLTDGIDSDPDAVLMAADSAKSKGARLFTIGFGEVDPMVMVLSATSPEDHYYAPDTSTLADIYSDIALRLLAEVLAHEMTIVDEVPANMRFVVGSDQPSAVWDDAARTLTWHLTDIPFAGTTLRYELEPTSLGRHPTNIDATAEFRDGLNQEGSLRFPVPYVDVLAKDPTPTATSTPFPTPTATPRPPKPVFLPITLAQECKDLEFHADLVLVMDTSGSMKEPSREGGVSKMEAAIKAARAFVSLLNLPEDRAAVVSFDNEARLELELTGDREALLAALDELESAAGTRIDLGLEIALDELTSERAREDQNRTIVLLTDGRSSVENQKVLDVAQRCRDEELVVFTIGLGTPQDVDFDLLRNVASDPDYFYAAPTTDDLDRIYREIAFTLECVNLDWP